MRTLAFLFLFTTTAAQLSTGDNATRFNDYKIARSVRRAVRMADSTLLHTSSMKVWRDYLKVACSDLDVQLHPLLLIKFDEDVRFRRQLQTIVQWERQWHKRETAHYIYYYRWDQPPPELILEVQEAHFNEISRLFEIEPEEKIPFRYDLSVNENVVYPFDDLRGGIVSAQPFDLESGALALLYFVSRAPLELLKPVARIYGRYFQNPSTAEAYYRSCLHQIDTKGYTSILTLFEDAVADQKTPSPPSHYVFIYELDRQFGPKKLVQFLRKVDREDPPAEVVAHFSEVFGQPLSEFESQFQENTTKKM